MKRFAPLLLVVVALAAVPAAFADGGRAPAPQRAEIMRLRLQLAHLRYRIVCHDRQSDRCAKLTQTLVTRLTTLDGAIQNKLTELQCAADSTERKCDVLSKLDARIQKALSSLQNGGSPDSSESALDAAAAAVAHTQP